MYKIINPSTVTASKLKSGVYASILPEYYELNKVNDNNPWHLKQNVFDHVVAVYAGLEQVLALKFLPPDVRTNLETYLKTKHGKYTRQELLQVATILHDIAKSITVIGNPPNTTSAPGHEVIGSVMVADFAPRFDLDEKGTERVKQIVLYHGFSHDILNLIINKYNPIKYMSWLKKVAPDFYIELLLLAYADMLGSDLKGNLPQEFVRREKIITQLLNQ